MLHTMRLCPSRNWAYRLTLDALFYSYFELDGLDLEVSLLLFEILTCSTLKNLCLMFNCFCFSKKLVLIDGEIFGLHLSHGLPDL
jgi:hypothetical protein